MRIAFLILVLLAQRCHAQEDYSAKLSARLEEIKELTVFNNGVVILDDSSNYGSTYPHWEPTRNYYQDEVVTLKGKSFYLAVVDSKGKNPETSANEWRLIGGVHPYFFLRDTAKIEDLKALVTSDHPYIRVYAFGALAHRKYDHLFQIVLENLDDTTTITQFTSDYGYDVRPADLMLEYTIADFTREQKDILKDLILSRYTHLKTLEEVLLFHKASDKDYRFVKELAHARFARSFSLVALARYQKPEDIEIIQEGFNEPEYYGGYKIFFMAIENFPHLAFKKNLVNYGRDLKMHYDMSGYDYYFRSLAAFKDRECFKVLNGFVNQMTDLTHDYRSAHSRTDNLRMIYRALKKYHIPMYNNLMKKIERNFANRNDLKLYGYRLESSPWNY